MRLPILALILITLSAWPARAQDAADSQAKCIISGTVLDANTQQPLKGAQVVLRGSMLLGLPSGSQPPAPQSLKTDADGRFTFPGLKPDRYVLRAFRQGYLPDRRAGVRVLILSSPGQHEDDVVLPLLPGAVIAGHVVNEARKPLPGVSLQAIRVKYAGGPGEPNDAAEVTTNQAGEYRITALAPGKYYLRASYFHALENKSETNKTYAPLCYPGTSDFSACVPLIVHAGEELAGIDLNFVPVNAFRLRCRVVDVRAPAVGKSSQVTLLSDQQGELTQLNEASTDAKGSFEFPSIPPGTYVIVAQQPQKSEHEKAILGMKSVEIRDVNVENIEVEVSPGVDINGRIRVEGKSNVDLSTISVDLEPQNSSIFNFVPEVDNASVRPDGSFTLHDVPQGSYRLNLFPVPSGFYLKSGGAGDLLESGITVGPRHSPPNLELVLSPETAQVDGTVVNDDQPCPGVWVVAVPEGKAHAQADNYRRARTDRLGRFTLRSLPPGDYKIFAWEQVEPGPVIDSDLPQQYEDRGKAVHLEEDARVNVELELIRVE